MTTAGQVGGGAIATSAQGAGQLGMVSDLQGLLDSVIARSTAGICAAEAIRDAGGTIIDFRWLLANDAALRLMGLPGQHIIGRCVLEVIPGLKDSGLFDKYVNVADTGTPYRVQRRYAHDGLDFVADISATRFGDGIAVTFADITEHKVAQQALTESIERFERVLATVQDVIYVIDAQGRFTSLSDAFATSTGWTCSEWVGQPFANLIHPTDLPFVASRFAITMGGESPPAFETGILCKDGSYRTFQVSIAPSREQGRITGVIGVGRDVTERRAEEAVRARLAAIIESSDDAIISATLDGTINSWNAGAEQIFGYAAKEAVGRPLDIICPPELKAGADRLLELVRQGRRVAHHEIDRLKKGNERICVSVSISPIRDAAGNITGISKIARDVSTQRRAGDTLRFQKALLEAQSEVSIEGILVTSPGGSIVSYNRRFAELWNLSSEVLASRSDDDALRAVSGQLVDPAAFAARVAHLMRNLDERGRDEIQLRDGRTFDRYTAPLCDGDGTSYGRIWYFRDVSEQKQAERALAESERFARSALDALTSHIAILDQHGTIIAVNSAWRKFGEDAGDGGNGRTGVGANYLDTCDRSSRSEDDTPASVARGLRAIISGEQSTFTIEYPCHAPNERRWFAMRASRFAGDGPVRVVVAHDNVTDRRTAEERLRHDSLHDALTGLPNRAMFNERIAQEAAKATGDAGVGFAVLFLDLDRFKVINDSLGHAAGDRLLVTISERLRRVLQAATQSQPHASFEVARLGGDEFTVLLAGLRSASDAARIAEQLLAAVAHPVDYQGQEMTTTASIGIVLADRANPHPRDLLRDADAAMYKAKAEGKNRYAIFDETMHAQAMQRLRAESELRHAVSRNEMQLHYQPVVALSTGALAGFEALLRWSKDGALIKPLDFIPIAEDTGLIVPIGRWVISEAVRQAAVWRAQLPSSVPLRVAVNVSRRQLQDPGLVAHVRAQLQTHALDPADLMLEITESVIMDDRINARDMLDQLRAIGVRVAVDDFGTGYSSLSCLHKFPVDLLKVDRAFIANLDRRRDAAVLHAVMDLAHNLSMTVVAEGIEKAEQVAFLQAVGCDLGQGFLFAKPLSADEATAYLRQSRIATAA
ncbi:MAG TPA: EAL domain-containing protein [Tepidisphaeraceae bacterium]|jgi:diguanylate cyclase (GGDEF)-like protein/PAS domain S-box-containing protein|nr:EAL domain-containing protein [Tepidisphaeraceae bacterium]